MVEPVVLVTGCGGFLAGALTPQLRLAWPRARLVGVGRRAATDANVSEAVVLDLGEGAALAELVAELQPDIVFHLAGRVSAGTPGEMLRDNLLATQSLLEVVSQHAPRSRVVVAGSAAECGVVDPDRLPVREDHPLRPLSPYGVSKACQRLAALSFAGQGLHVVVGRVFNIAGRRAPSNTSLGSFAEQLRDIVAGRREPVMRVGNLSGRRDFVDVDDVATALLALATKGDAGELYNICSGRSASIGELLDQLIVLSRRAVRIETEPARLRAGDVPEVYGSAAKIHAACGWAPRVSLTDSLAAMLAG